VRRVVSPANVEKYSMTSSTTADSSPTSCNTDPAHSHANDTAEQISENTIFSFAQ